MPPIKDIFLWGPERLGNTVRTIIKDISALLWGPERLRITLRPIIKDISLLLWRPQRRRRTMRAPKVKSKPANRESTIVSPDAIRGSPNTRQGKLQYPIGSTDAMRGSRNIRRVIDSTDAVRESPNISHLELQSPGGSTDAIRGSTNPKPRVLARQIIAKFLTKVTMAAVYWRKLITTAPRPAPRDHEFATIKPKDMKRRGIGTAGALAISICFALLVMCGIAIPMLLLQIRDMRADITLLKMRFAAVDAHFTQLEIQQKTKEAKTVESPPPPPPPRRQVQIALSNDEIKLIRGFIKVVPSQPGAQQKVQLGQEISTNSTVPVPGSLVGQIAKLRGARFLVDDNGAIIISGEGSNRADVVIDPQ